MATSWKINIMGERGWKKEKVEEERRRKREGER